jgi:hypothetical protein
MEKIILSESQVNSLLYHGSPKYFKNFDYDLIGSTTNVNRLGWGFYFTLEEGVII